MKSFKELFFEVEEPKAKGEKRFKDKHVIKKTGHPVANDTQFTPKTQKKKRQADLDSPEDEAVYEETDLDEKYVLKHKKTKEVLDYFDDYEDAKDAHDGLGKEKANHGIFKQSKKDSSLRHRNQGTSMREETDLVEALQQGNIFHYLMPWKYKNTSNVRREIERADTNELLDLLIQYNEMISGGGDAMDAGPQGRKQFVLLKKELLRRGFDKKDITYMKSDNVHKFYEETEELSERELTSSEKDKLENIVKSMKTKKEEFKKRYGDKWKSVMYATATKVAKKNEEN